MAHLPNKSYYHYPIQLPSQNVNYAQNYQLKEQHRIPTKSLINSHPQNINHPLQKPIPSQQSVYNVPNHTK